MASSKWWRSKWWQRQGHDHTPDLWVVWLVAPIWVTVAIALAVVIYLPLHAVAVPRPGPNAGPAPRDPLDVIKTTITVAGFVGAVLVGVYGYRKQRLVEGDARRADAEQLAQRYTTAAGQLGHEKAAVRLAGVYAMARLADDWDDQRQVCIDVLCAYLRMPYEPDTASEKHREGEREVRYTIIRIIRDHLRDPSASTTWCGRSLDFRNTTFDGGDFGGRSLQAVRSPSTTRNSPVGSPFAIRNSPVEWSPSPTRGSPMAGSPSTARNSPAARSFSYLRSSPAVLSPSVARSSPAVRSTSV
jgi:hypothetical protein